MTKKSERFWSIAGTLLVLFWLLFFAFDIGKRVGSRPSENEQKAYDSLTHALQVIDTVDTADASSEVCEAFDTVMDDINDALAWMEKEP